MTGGIRAAAAGLCAALAAVPAQAVFEDTGVAVLRGLDKITARVWTFDVTVGEPVRFGTLEITVWACRERPPHEPPESAAFLQVFDFRHHQSEVPLFRGWMFASSPALSAIEHAVYDVWMIDCKER